LVGGITRELYSTFQEKLAPSEDEVNRVDAGVME
jgi:hypothetical protein